EACSLQFLLASFPHPQHGDAEHRRGSTAAFADDLRVLHDGLLTERVGRTAAIAASSAASGETQPKRSAANRQSATRHRPTWTMAHHDADPAWGLADETEARAGGGSPRLLLGSKFQLSDQPVIEKLAVWAPTWAW